MKPKRKRNKTIRLVKLKDEIIGYRYDVKIDDSRTVSIYSDFDMYYAGICYSKNVILADVFKTRKEAISFTNNVASITGEQYIKLVHKLEHGFILNANGTEKKIDFKKGIDKLISKVKGFFG